MHSINSVRPDCSVESLWNLVSKDIFPKLKDFAIKISLETKGVRKGGLGLNPPLEFAMLQKRHYLCKGVCVCLRTFFACLMSTYRKNHRMILHENFKEHCKWTKKK